MLGPMVGVRGFPERDISSLCVMGWGWEMLGNSSAAVAAAAVGGGGAGPGPGPWARALGPGPMGVEKKSRKNRGKTSSQNGVCLVGKLSGHLGRVFLDYLEAPSSHIRQNMFWDGIITKFN